MITVIVRHKIDRRFTVERYLSFSTLRKCAGLGLWEVSGKWLRLVIVIPPWCRSSIGWWSNLTVRPVRTDRVASEIVIGDQSSLYRLDYR